MNTVPKPSNPKPEAIPDKLYFRIGEVGKLAGIPTYVLRFWETEFSQIRPKRTPAGQRLYRRKDVELIFQIKSLLYERRFTIEGAKKHLGASVQGAAAPTAPTLVEIRHELERIKEMLKAPPQRPRR